MPSLHVDYKHSTIKQYHKEGRALRTETTINNTHDFKIGKRLKNLPALRQIGFRANRRLLDVQRLLTTARSAKTRSIGWFAPPRSTASGPRRCASATTEYRPCSRYWSRFSLQLRGFTNQEMRPLLAQLLGLDPADYSPRKNDLRPAPPAAAGIIERIPHTHRYQLTADGLRIALFFSRTYARLLRPKLAEIMPEAPPIASALRAAFDRLAPKSTSAARRNSSPRKLDSFELYSLRQGL